MPSFLVAGLVAGSLLALFGASLGKLKLSAENSGLTPFGDFDKLATEFFRPIPGALLKLHFLVSRFGASHDS